MTARSWRLLVSAAALTLSFGAFAQTGSVFAGATVNENNSLAALTLAAPSALSATCGLVGVNSVDVELSWEASPTAGITGYEVLHDAPDGDVTFNVVGTTGPSQTSFTHTVSGSLLSFGTHTYAVRAVLGPWASPNSNTDAVSITEVLVIVCSNL